MKTEQLNFELNENNLNTSIQFQIDPELILIFASSSFFENPCLFEQISNKYPESHILACSTAGEIQSNLVTDSRMAITAIQFDKTTLVSKSIEIGEIEDSYDEGLRLGSSFDQEELKHVFVLSAGLVANGDELVQGIRDSLPSNVNVTGGLAGDGDRFEFTYVLDDKNQPSTKAVKAIGFYGDDIEISYSSTGGWEETNTRYRVTKSENNILYKINNKPALKVYKEYLGEKASQLPGVGLKHPFNMKIEGFDEPVVRTILGIDEESQSLIFAGNIVKGSTLKIMKASVDRIIEGARESADTCLNG